MPELLEPRLTLLPPLDTLLRSFGQAQVCELFDLSLLEVPEFALHMLQLHSRALLIGDLVVLAEETDLPLLMVLLVLVELLVGLASKMLEELLEYGLTGKF